MPGQEARWLRDPRRTWYDVRVLCTVFGNAACISKTDDRNEILINDNEVEIDCENENEFEDSKDLKLFDLRKMSVEGEFKNIPIGVKFGSELVGFFSLNITKGLFKFNPNLRNVQANVISIDYFLKCGASHM